MELGPESHKSTTQTTPSRRAKIKMNLSGASNHPAYSYVGAKNELNPIVCLESSA
ncbi:hypothetical protein PT974_04343 [Cladobotryum mycophilum]|uniref:Uncharacterized protein n=1 Tax=Cladobotryum mycophilum TaxID=491253 RepID=A0ABR0SUX2_9HYPO